MKITQETLIANAQQARLTESFSLHPLSASLSNCKNDEMRDLEHYKKKKTSSSQTVPN